MGEVGLRTVVDGKATLRFNAEVIGASTSERAGVPRWSELVVYKLAGGQYLISKVGHSTVAHRPTCEKANPRTMRSIGQLRGEVPVRRTPCTLCWPDVGNEIDLRTLMEADRHSVLQAHDARAVVQTLTNGRVESDLPELVLEVLRQACKNDPEIAPAWASTRSPQ